MDKDSYGSPPELVEAARAVLGGIDLDPCSNEKAQKIVRAKTHWTKDLRGDLLFAELVASQRNAYPSVFCNPPFSRPSLFTTSWARLTEHSPRILVINNATDTEWFRYILDKVDPMVCFAKRISFLHPETQLPVKGNRYAQLILYAGPAWREQLFTKEFSQFGVVRKLVRG